jgi:hypothetical protein
MNRDVSVGARTHAAFILLLVGVALLSACQTTPPDVAAYEDKLAAAGFVKRVASTPQRQAMLARLPPNQFLIRQNGDTLHYVYADPLVCGCLYVGTQQAYDQYRANQQLQQFVDEQRLSAQMYADDAWSWGAWGPWEPAEAGFGFTYAPAGL